MRATPMQWDASPNAGFTTGEPWIMVNPNYTQINAAQQVNDPDSVLLFISSYSACASSTMCSFTAHMS